MEGKLVGRGHWERIIEKVKAFNGCSTTKEEEFDL
jgi:hypothetical protein